MTFVAYLLDGVNSFADDVLRQLLFPCSNPVFVHQPNCVSFTTCDLPYWHYFNGCSVAFSFWPVEKIFSGQKDELIRPMWA